MKQDADVDSLIRQRIRGLRVARGWSLDELARRCHLSPSNLSRIETGHRRIALDQLVPIARALGTTLDQLVESAEDDDVVIRPQRDEARGLTTWLLTPRERAPHGVTVAKMRIAKPGPLGDSAGRLSGSAGPLNDSAGTVRDNAGPLSDSAELRVHPGRDWFTVLSGTARLQLGERTILVEAGQAAEFSTMIPHAFGAHEGPVEILCIFDPAGEQAHRCPSA
jgi:transcriptional regulator with XRE-family HTH domain/quercetin dioxygenase-like cupin family protein